MLYAAKSMLDYARFNQGSHDTFYYTAMKKGRRKATAHLLLPWADEVSSS